MDCCLYVVGEIPQGCQPIWFNIFQGIIYIGKERFFRKHPCEVAVFQVGHAQAERARCHGGVAPRTFEVVRFLGRCMCQ